MHVMPLRNNQGRSLNLPRWVAILLSLLLGAATLTGTLVMTGETAEASTVSQAVEGKTFRIATDTTFAPFEFRDTTGELVGIDMDLIRQIAEREGFKVEIQSLGFNAALQALTSKQADAVSAVMTITADAMEVFDFRYP